MLLDGGAVVLPVVPGGAGAFLRAVRTKGGDLVARIEPPRFDVPDGYTVTRNADGSATVTGPGGGAYNSTGRYSAAGKQIYGDNSGHYFTLDGGRHRVTAPPDYSSIPIHHVCTNKCTEWTPRFRKFFDNA